MLFKKDLFFKCNYTFLFQVHSESYKVRFIFLLVDSHKKISSNVSYACRKYYTKIYCQKHKLYYFACILKGTQNSSAL